MEKITHDIIDAISAAQTVLVCGHIRPDGDCVCSALAMRAICGKLGKKADAVCDAEKPSSFAFLPDYDKFCAPTLDRYDLFIAVDCAEEKRLGGYAKHLGTAKNVINIDHHPTNPNYGKINYVDGSACSVCAIIFDLFRDSGLLDGDIAQMLYTGLSTDTGHFMHSNTGAHVFDIASALCGLGLDASKVNRALYRNMRMQKMQLIGKAINSISLHRDGQISLMTITLDDLRSCGCGPEDTEGLIDYASSVAGVKISISICEQPGELFRVSLRSPSADVSAVAARFGGGGHRLAAGCIIKGNRYDVADRIVSAAAMAL